MRKTKIVATLGPATDRGNILEEMIEAGVDVVRLNFSHGHHKEHEKRILWVKKLSQEYGPVAILVDTRGPELRLGRIEEEKVTLIQGERLFLTGRDIPGTKERLSINYPDITSFISPNQCILLSDGLVELKVLQVEDEILCKVLNSGEVSSFKGVNIPGVSLGLPSLTPQDELDISFAVKMGVDFVAASFVRRAQDVLEVRRIIEENAGDQEIIAKIENEEGVLNIEGILHVADGLMVARGDLGVEIPPEKIPSLQKSMIRLCNEKGKPVITATQMLESMIHNPRPTRAEASDVANAIFDGTDATMLSGETAIGKYPLEAVKTMARIAVEAEGSLSYRDILNQKRLTLQRTVTDSISFSTCDTAYDLKAEAIITATRSGYTARMVSKYRPRSLIIAATPNERILRQLLLLWGVSPILVPSTENTDTMIDTSVQAALDHQLIKEGDLVVITAGTPVGVPGTTNLLKVHVAGEVIIKGTGIGEVPVTGRVWLVLDPDKIEEEPRRGSILVISYTTREMMPAIEGVKAIIAEEEGLTSKTAILGIELDIPVIVGAKGATSVLKDNALITVDSPRGLIYYGRARVL